jgi:signal transduction histidine kinase/AraC-like DNA-binding protein/ActR/RegA family two-component response regulator
MRYRAYQDTLKKHQILLDPNLVVDGTFFPPSGADAIRVLLDERKQKFDVLVAANDYMALDALHALQERGFRVPEEVAVTGFDNTVESRLSVPPLTTVLLPVEYEGQTAMNSVLDLLRGSAAPRRIDIPLEIVIRQSCGCRSWAAEKAKPGIEPDLLESSSPRELLESRRELLKKVYAGTIGQVIVRQGDDLFTDFWDGFISDLFDQRSEFLPAVKRLIQALGHADDDLTLLQGFLAEHRFLLQPRLPNRDSLSQAENSWQVARLAIAEAVDQIRARQQLASDTLNARLRAVGQLLMTTFDLDALMNVLAQELPGLGIASCYVAVYEGHGGAFEKSRLLLAYEQNAQIEIEKGGRPFDTLDILPAEFWPKKRRFAFTLQPLYFQQDQIGYLILEIGPHDGVVYETLRLQLSNALKGARLVNEAYQAREAALQAQARAEKADRLKSDFLALVSHELRTPLHLVVGMSEMMMIEGGDRPSLPDAFRSDLDRIRSEAQHLDRLLRDVLDLATSQAGELRLARETIIPDRMFDSIIAAGKQLTMAKGLTWKAVLPKPLPAVTIDWTRIRQVILNLIANAVKFTSQGSVSLSVEVGAGEMLISVSDTGVGVPESERESVFDEFRQSSRTSTRGFGGIGLGLAISKRLVEMHGGRIGVRPGIGDVGSTFFFTLPLAPANDAFEEKSGDVSNLVLVLVNQPAEGKEICSELEKQGFITERISIQDTPDFMDKIRQAPPGGIVFGADIEKGRGWDVLKALKENRQTEEIPMVFYSPSQDGGAVLALDYAQKPMEPVELGRALARQKMDEASAILIVDDEPGLRDLHSRMVLRVLPKANVRTAANGREALEILTHSPIDLVLLDLMMPEVDGFAVLEKMRARDELRSIPVIVLTAQALTEQVMDRLNRNVASVLEKGLFSQAEVIRQIEIVLSRSKRLGSDTQRLVRRAMAYLNEHYAEELSIEMVAGKISVSERHLNRSFKNELGMTVMDYLRRYRIQQSKILLDQRRYSVAEVAAAVGFSTANHFARVFRLETGLSPSEFLKQ